MTWLGAGARCLVTGGSAGIGYETARCLAALGAQVVITGRHPERTPAAAAAIATETGAHVDAELCDFSCLENVRTLAQRLRDKFDGLEVLVNNAGLWHRERQVSADGHEATLAVNHFAPFVLTLALEPLLGAVGHARVVHVSSRRHVSARPHHFDDLALRRYPRQGLVAYDRSKLANILFSNKLAERWRGTGITSNAVHPGSVATTVTRGSAVARFGQRLIAPFLSSPLEGAATTLYVATADELRSTTGRYFANCRATPPSSHALDDALAARVWGLTERAVGGAPR